MTDVEYGTMFALWCLAKSPLMLGVDLRTLTRESTAYAIITNPGLLAVNQVQTTIETNNKQQAK